MGLLSESRYNKKRGETWAFAIIDIMCKQIITVDCYHCSLRTKRGSAFYKRYRAPCIYCTTYEHYCLPTFACIFQSRNKRLSTSGCLIIFHPREQRWLWVQKITFDAANFAREIAIFFCWKSIILGCLLYILLVMATSCVCLRLFSICHVAC